MPKASVIIPCYNQGQYLNEAVRSVLDQTFQDFEIIIINDGSTDEITNEILRNYYKHYNKLKINVITTSNQGLPSARNNGIREAQGCYILPLDADDKIGSTYLEKAITLLDENPNLGIVYCEAEYFGDISGKWDLPKYSFPEILYRNQIFCSAFFRRADWERVGGYKPAMKYGWEDHEFWLSLIELKRDIHQIPEELFFYRQKQGSMINSMTKMRQLYSYWQLYINHSSLYRNNFNRLVELFNTEESTNNKQKNCYIYKMGRLFTKIIKFMLR